MRGYEEFRVLSGTSEHMISGLGCICEGLSRKQQSTYVDELLGLTAPQHVSQLKVLKVMQGLVSQQIDWKLGSSSHRP